MSLRSNLAACIRDRAHNAKKSAKQFKRETGVTYCLPDYVEKYDRETDTLTCVSHYYKECPRLQGVFFYQNGSYLGYQTRLYQSTRNLKTLQQKQTELNNH